MKKLSSRTYWILAFVLLLISVGCVFLTTQVSGNWTTVMIVLMAISFILTTLCIQAASFRMFNTKSKKMNYPTKDFKGNFDELPTLLKNAKYKERKTEYGPSYLRIKGDTAYKVVIVRDVAAYFNPEHEEESYKANHDLDKCSKFIGVEIFSEIAETDLAKIPDFSMMGTKVYYTALLYQGENNFKCLNYIEPNEQFKDGLASILDDLQIEEIKTE